MSKGPDFNTESNLHPDTVAERFDSRSFLCLDEGDVGAACDQQCEECREQERKEREDHPHHD